jgi:hypothetical protein
MSPPPDPTIAASLILLANNIYKKKPSKIHSMGHHVISHWTSEAKNKTPPAITAALILTAKLMLCKENPAKTPDWQKIRQSIPLLI